MRCRWDDGRGSSGEGDEVIAGQMGVLGSGLGNGAVSIFQRGGYEDYNWVFLEFVQNSWIP